MLSSTPQIPNIPSPPQPTRRPGAKLIHPSKFPEVRVKLRQYRMAVQLQGVAVPPGLSSSSPFASRSSRGTTSTASRTQPRAPSESSYATSRTSRTNLTAVWSVRDGIVHHEPEKKPLDPVLKARKALVRYLKKCDGLCQGRKVKCLLWHHSLEDILDGNHDDQTESDVYWALRFDSDPKSGDFPSSTFANQSIYEEGEGEMALPEESSPPMKEVMDHVTYKFDIPATPDLLYPDTITIDDAHPQVSLPDPDEPSLHLLPPVFAPPPRATREPRFSTRKTPSTLALPPVYAPPPPPEPRFSTHKTTSTLALATEVRAGPYHYYYQCLLPMGGIGACVCSFPSLQHLLAHVQQAHAGFVPLRPDPRRLVCLGCFAFHAAPVAACVACGAVPARLVVSIYGEFSLESEGAGVGVAGGLEMASAYGAGPAAYVYDAFGWENY